MSDTAITAADTPFPLPFLVEHKVAVAPVRTLRELEMMRLSALIRAKPEWYRKVADPDVVAAWRREAAEQGMTEAQVEYVLAELTHYAELRDPATGIEVSGVDGVWQSDTLIDEELTGRLRQAVRVLEDVPEAERDWHPGSDGQVLDLVHPSLFCRVRGVSRGGAADDWPTPGEDDAYYALSDRFQWLPTDVDVAADGQVSFASYVNNVHPEDHRELAAVLPDVVARMRPLFENVLTDLRHPRAARIVADPYGWYHDAPDRPGPDADKEVWTAFYEAMDVWWQERVPTVPDAPVYAPPAVPEAAARVDLRGRRLQIIVKLATIHLTPERPDYPGGSWHVEGMMNERIVSTGIHYWDSENITESRLAFRAAIDDPRYEQNDDDGVREIYGLSDEDPLNQVLGSAETRGGRTLAFPNILQHRVAPFRLADPARPGHRKILAVFLVDPGVTVVSTSDIPPQQPWAPTSTMTRAQAEEFREQLMQERKYFVSAHNEDVFEREFSLCEH